MARGQRRGSLFAPFHWSDATASHGRVGALAQGLVDPLSGQPELKATPAAIAPAPFARRGFVLARGPIAPPPEGWWWARVAIEGGSGLLFATNAGVAEAAAYLDRLCPGLERAAYADAAGGVYRAAAYGAEGLAACLFLGPPDALPAWEAARAHFAGAPHDPAARRALITGRGAAAGGPTVCACHGVGRGAITAAIAGGCATSEAVGAATRAGTNCGSCVPEIRRLLAGAAVAEVPVAA